MNKDFDPQKLIGLKHQDIQVTFTQKDAILYALGIGYSQGIFKQQIVHIDPLKQADYKFTYELSDQFTAFPTFGTCFHGVKFIKTVADTPRWPPFDPAMVLHAEQRLQMIAPSIKPNTPYVTKRYIKDVIDKGKMTLVCLGIDVYQKVDGKQIPTLKNQTTLALMKFNGNGFKGLGIMAKLPSLPKRNADCILQAVTYPNQAFVYRLSGDYNPLHVDPKFATIQKFPRPIIHGLASKGIIARTIVQKLLNNDPSKMKCIHSRFTGHVFPGQSFQIKVWKQNNSLAFEAKCKQRGTLVMSGWLDVRQAAKL